MLIIGIARFWIQFANPRSGPIVLRCFRGIAVAVHMCQKRPIWFGEFRGQFAYLIVS